MEANVALVVLEALVVAAAVIDWRTSRLPNWLTFGGLGCGLVLSLLPATVSPLHAALGAASALAVMLPLWLLRATGAGDVKLLAAVGAFAGVPGIFFVLLFTMLAGGAFALGLAIVRGNAMRTSANAFGLLEQTAWAAMNGHRPDTAAVASVGKLPYGVCICIGTSAWIAWQVLGR
jgi:prepilin peptidase CpaA